jgi:hypothetical protein
MDAVVCPACVFVLVGWCRDHRRDKRARHRWELRRGMTLEEELEARKPIAWARPPVAVRKQGSVV